MTRVKMVKAQHYVKLQEIGLPVPIYGVFDANCLCWPYEERKLYDVCSDIILKGSGRIGVRTEPKKNLSPLGRYPHYMPLFSFTEVKEAMERCLIENNKDDWWFLVNEAFEQNTWNAVVQLVPQGRLGRPELVGEVNPVDDMPLRPAMKSSNIISVSDWHCQDKVTLHYMLLDAGLFNTYCEVSRMTSRGQSKIIFWGMR